MSKAEGIKSPDMQIINETMKNLEKNNMKAFYCETSQAARALVSDLISKGAMVASGGSQTLRETGITDLLRSGEYNYLDRSVPGLSAEQIEDIYLGAFRSDVYLLSANALTRHGELYNVDGNSNRVAALLYGPQSVIVVCGYNKITKNIDEAINRVKSIAAPKNTVRLHTGSYCEAAGECVSLLKDGAYLCDGCSGSGRICCNYVVTAAQRKKDRIKVIIVGEQLGY